MTPRWHRLRTPLHKHQHNSMQLVIIEKHMLFSNMLHCTMERLHKFANGPSLQSLLMFLLVFLNLGYQAHPPLSTLFLQLLMNISFIYSWNTTCYHILGFSKHIRFHVLEMETPKCPRATNLSSSFSIHSLLIFPT
jgi:hypothetical protein